MDHDLLIRQHDQLVQLAQELASASEALATRMVEDDGAIAAPTAYVLLTHLMNTLTSLPRTTEMIRSRLVASLHSTEIIQTNVAASADEARDSTRSVLAADAAILTSTTSCDLAERCLSKARNAISGQV